MDDLEEKLRKLLPKNAKRTKINELNELIKEMKKVTGSSKTPMRPLIQTKTAGATATVDDEDSEEEESIAGTSSAIGGENDHGKTKTKIRP